MIAAASGILLATTGCASVGTLEVYRTLGSKQCEGGGKTSVQLRAELEAARVVVKEMHCGRDGRMHPAMCGAGDGKIAIFLIDARDLERARSAGYAPLTDLPEARREQCGLEALPRPPVERRRQ